MDRDARISELEREVAALRAELARVQSAGPAGEDPAIGRLLSDRGLLSSLPDVIMILDRSHRVLYLNRVNPGLRVEDYVGRNVLEFLPPDERPARLAALELAWESGEISTIDSQSNLGYHWENRLVPIKENGRVTYLLTTAVDVTERKRAEKALRESESRLRLAMDATGMGTWVSRSGAEEIVFDDGLCRIYGVTRETAPTNLEEFMSYVHPDDRFALASTLEAARARGVYEDLEFRIVRADGAIRQVLAKGALVLDETGVPIASYGGVFDVTDRRRLEEQLRQVQKMEAIGQLTAGIAHNFNNVLGVILPNVELARREAPPGIAARLDDVAHAAERGAELVRQLMIFARREVGARKEPIDLSESARRTADICRTTFDRRIEIALAIEPGVPRAIANSGQIEQVLLNICLNARDAFDLGRSAASAAAHDPGAARPRIEIRLARSETNAVRLRISDNGSGMDEATRSRVFEPFFTTKGEGRGTGLGLATAYAIVSGHRGRITCESRVGEGTVFEIELPSTEQSPAAPSAAPDALPARGGTETLLLVEDEPLVRGAVRGLLELGGYEVLEAADGNEALATYERERGRIAAVIVDRLMPGLSGEEVLARLKSVDPGVPVVLLSGHPGRADRFGRASAVLAKPTSADTLLRTLRSVIEAREAATG